ncbi:hypothetical protein ES703_80912 [subsurface metagenome]
MRDKQLGRRVMRRLSSSLLSTGMILLAALFCQQPESIGGPSLEEIQALRLDRSVSGHETIPDPFDTLKLSRADVDRMIIETRDRLHNDITEAELVTESLKIKLTDDYFEIVEEMLNRLEANAQAEGVSGE